MLQLIILMLVLVGLSASNPLEDRIVNGTNASSANARYIVSIRGPNNVHRCGGTVVDRNAVLTSAHCVRGLLLADITIQYGMRVIDTTNVNTVTVRVAIIHPGFNEEDRTNDIALIIISVDFPAASVGIITLNENPNVPAVGAAATLYGWGSDRTGGSIQTSLKQTELTIYSNRECSRLHNRQIPDTNICTGARRAPNRGQCVGDSGGPVIVNGIQTGIISWSVKPCGARPYPGVSTRVANYMSWIRQVYAAANGI